MANRFLDSNYYKSPFVRGLKGSLKSLYSFIICDCNGAGVWNLDLQAASLFTGFTITTEEFENHFIITGKAYPIGGEKYFFPDFIEHQYPNGLKANNPAHKNFIKILKKHDLLDINLKVVLKGALKGLPSPIGLSNGNGNVLEGVQGEVYFDAEKVVLDNRIEFERILIATSKNLDVGKASLRNYHLWLAENEKYPKTRKAIFAGFEKWLHNEKNFKQNGKGTSEVGRSLEFDKP